MSSSPPHPTEPARDRADVAATVAGWAAVLALGSAVVWWGTRAELGPAPGETRIFPEMVLALAPAPMPAVAATPPAPPAEPPPEIAPATEPVVEPEPVPPEQEPLSPAEPIPPPDVEPAPAVPAQPMMREDGDAGAAAVRAEWLGELRRRIEKNKFYPCAARYSQETGTVWVRVAIGPDGRLGSTEIRRNTGSALLGRGALGILRRAAAQPLGTNALPAGFQVDMPFTYRLEPR